MSSVTLVALLTLLGSQAADARFCGEFGGTLITINSGAPLFIRLQPIGTCLRDGQLFFAYGVENDGAEAKLRIRIAHFTRGGLPMGSGTTSLLVRARSTEYTLAEWWQKSPFPLRASDVFVAAIVGVEEDGRTWRAVHSEVVAESRRAVRDRLR